MVSTEQEPAQRYWNEYDHPEDEETGGYYILVDPNANYDYPGAKWWRKVEAFARQIPGLRRSSDKDSSVTDDESSDDGTLDESPITRRPNYGTLPTSRRESQEGYFSSLFHSFRDPYRDAAALQERRSLLGELEDRQHKTEMTKLRFYSTCLLTAIVINFILGLMTVTSRKKERGAVDIGVLIGTICTLMLCGVAVISMKTRRERLGWLHQGMVLSIAGAVIAVDVLLLGWIVRI